MDLFLKVSFDSPVLLIWSICAGFNIAIIITYVVRRTTGALLNKLFEAEAFDTESAKTLAELDCKSKLYESSLKDGKTLRRIVSVANDEDKLPLAKSATGKEIYDFASAKFYIKEENKDRASSLKKGNLRKICFPIFTILSIILAQLIIDLLPTFTDW